MNIVEIANQIAADCEQMKSRPHPERVSVFPVVLTEDEMMILLNALDTRLDELDSRALLTMPESGEFALGQEIDATEALRERLDDLTEALNENRG